MRQKTPARIPYAGANAVPLYKQVKADLLQRISKGEWKPGEVLPTEQMLATHYRVGIATIRSAIGELVVSNIVDRIQGKGTFVSAHSRERDIYRFFHVVREDGIKELPKSELVYLKKARADHALNDTLGLSARGFPPTVFTVRNVLVVSGCRLVVSDIAIPTAMFPGLTPKVIREGGDTLYGVYQNHYGINIIRVTERLRAVKAPSDVAKVLSIQPRDPVLEINRIAYTFDNVPVEARRSWVRTDNFYYLWEQR